MRPDAAHPAIADGLIRMAQDIELAEALAVLADMTTHENDRIAEAARSVMRLSPHDEHYRQAFRTLQVLDQLELIP